MPSPFLQWWHGLPLFALAALSIACNSSGKSTATATPLASAEPAVTQQTIVKPTEGGPPISPVTATPLAAFPDVPFCTRTDIATAVSSNAATGGQLLADIVIGNRSSMPCQISRVPDVQLLDVHSDVVPTEVTLGPTCPFIVAPGVSQCIFQQPTLLLPGLGSPQPHVVLKPGQVALRLAWHIHNGAGTCPTPPPIATQVRLLLPDEEAEVVMDVTAELPDGIAPCDGTVQILAYGPGTAE